VRGAGQLLLDEADRFERGQRALAGLLLAGRNREDQRIEEQVGWVDAVLVDDDVVDALGDLELPLGGIGLAPLIDRERGPEPRPYFSRALSWVERLAAVLEVDRVNDRFCRCTA